jgi:DNA-binding CsgD family transcriptional regulator
MSEFINGPMEDVIDTDAQLGARALAFALDVRGLTAMDDLAAALQREIAPLGLTAVASGLVSGPKAASDNPFHFTNWPPDWVALYVAEEFLPIDPAARWARGSGQAMTWSDLIRAIPARDPGRKVIEAAARAGFTEGMAVPMRSGDNSLGLVSFGGSRDSLSPGEQSFLIMIARAAFEAGERIEHAGKIGRPAPILSAREIECIVLLVRGHSDRQIGKLLNLSAATVRFHLGNAREKFSAASRTHLAALAVAQGYVSL